MSTSFFIDNLAEHNQLFSKLAFLNAVVVEAIHICSTAISQGQKLMFCGNGGSAADSQHLAAEFTGRYKRDRIPLPALALSTDTSALTCISNDYSFDDVFSRQVYALGKPGDCLIAISTSGNSKNVIEAVKSAAAKGISTIGLLGNDGGNLKRLCSLSIVVPSTVTARIQEAHILIGHTICEGIEGSLGLSSLD